jgi:diphthine-ammonia ligase
MKAKTPQTRRERVIVSWSGGKDCCLALCRAMRRGYEVTALVNLVAESTGRCCFHGVDGGLLRLQAESLGVWLVQKAVPDDMKEYEREFKVAVSGFSGMEGMIFGDIYLDEHKEWVERVCRDVGIEAIEPLWNEDPVRLVTEFIDLGFEAVVVSCKADVMGREFIGRRVDKPMIAELEARDVCPCGENGEFHTLVVNGPMFRRKIEILEAEPVLKDGFWKHWAWDIRKYR